MARLGWTSLLLIVMSCWAAPAPAAEVLGLPAPGSAPLTQNARELWAATRSAIDKDLAAGLGESDCQARRTALYSAWGALQATPESEAMVSPVTYDAVGRVVNRVLELTDRVYGSPGRSARDRAGEPGNAERVRQLMKEIDARLAAIK